MLAAEDFLRAFRDGVINRSVEILLTSRADHGEGLPYALALIAELAARDAAEQRGVPIEQYLRALTSWILHHHASKDGDPHG